MTDQNNKKIWNIWIMVSKVYIIDKHIYMNTYNIYMCIYEIYRKYMHMNKVICQNNF